MRRRRRIQDRQSLQTSTLTTYSNDHPDVPTPHTPVCTLATSIVSMSTGVTTSPDGKSLDSWATSNNLGLLYNPKETASFFSRRWNVGTNPDLAFAGFGQDSRLPDRRVSKKVPAVTTSTLPHNATRIQGSCPQQTGEVLEILPRPIGSAFVFSQVNPWRDCHLRTHQILRGHTRIFARAYFLQLNNACHMAVGRTMCHVGTKSARPSIAPLSEPQWGLTLTEPPHLYSLNYNRRSSSDGRKLSTPSTSCASVARRGEHSTNLLAGLDAPLASAPSRQMPSPRNS